MRQIPISRAFDKQIEQAKGAEVIEDRLVAIFNDQIYSQFFAENDKALMLYKSWDEYSLEGMNIDLQLEDLAEFNEEDLD